EPSTSSGIIHGPPAIASDATQNGPFHYKSSRHGMELLQSLNSLRNDHILCDVYLLNSGHSLAAHRVVLSACSNYFRAMFSCNLSESKKMDIDMPGMDLCTLSSLIDFAYTGELRVTDSSVQQLLPAACLLQMTEVQDACCDFLRRQLDASNCLGIRAFADTHACRELVRSADKYTQHNFQDVMNSEEFSLLQLPQLLEIISSEELNVKSEEQVFTAAIQWVKHDMKHRKRDLHQVLSHVRLPLCPAKFIVSTVSDDPLVRQDPACRDLVDEAKNYLLLPLERSKMQGPRTRARKPLKYGEVLYAVGGWCSGDAIASVEMLDPQRQVPQWRPVEPMKKRRCGVGVAVLDDLLYAVGGHDGQSYLNSIERFDPATNEWSTDVAPTSTCRTSVGVAVLDGFLYAVGGQDGVSCLNVVERYDANRNEWSRVCSMSTRRLGVSVAVLNGCLYAVGGSDGQSPLNTVERYDPRTNKWYTVRSMYTRRKHLGSAVYGGALYAVGGRDDTTELSSAERYDPAADDWVPVVAMNQRRSGVGLAVVNDRLYAVGGFDGTTYLKSVEVYDTECKQWRMTESMTYRRLGGGVGVVRIASSDSISSRATDPLVFGEPPGLLYAKTSL
ncbi:hypothetical protein PFISCL1PPCAC_18818, partial [Pristionchus fissidentatus]